MSEIPSFSVLKAIEPEVKPGGSELHSPNLADFVDDYKQYEAPLWQKYLEEDTSDGDDSVAKKLARLYFLQTAQRQQNSGRAFWVEQFNHHVEELYGRATGSEAAQIASDELNVWSETPVIAELAEYENLFDVYRAAANALEAEKEDDLEIITDDERLRLAQSFVTVIAPALEIADEYRNKAPYSSADLREIFKDLVLSQAEKDPGWNEWKIVSSNKKQLAVTAANREIDVPDGRPETESYEDLRKLVAHEFGVHAMRAEAGYERGNRKLATGLSGYLDAEEGLGIFAEYLVSGEIPEKARDRYIDIAFAQGTFGFTLSREELIALGMDRQHLRDVMKGKTSEPVKVRKDVTIHVNRLFRGGNAQQVQNPITGEPQQPVFTKDLAYYNGLRLTERFSKKMLDAGISPDTLFAFLLQGKFDPTNIEHLKKVEVPEAIARVLEL